MFARLLDMRSDLRSRDDVVWVFEIPAKHTLKPCIKHSSIVFLMVAARDCVPAWWGREQEG